MNGLVVKLRRAEKAILMTDEEKEWFEEHRLYVAPLDWPDW